MGWVGKEYFGLLILMVAMFLLCEGKGYEEPLHCKKLECPSQEVMDCQKDHEIRSYHKVMWMSSPLVKSSSYKDGSDRIFNSLSLSLSYGWYIRIQYI